MPNYADRLQRVQALMVEQQIDMLFLNRSANLHYLTGIPRDEPNFGNTIYPGEWLTGAWIPPTGSPVLTLPRMMADFHMSAISGIEVKVLGDGDDPVSMAWQVINSFYLASHARVALEDRAWAETVLHLRRLLPQAVFSTASELLRPLRVIKDESEVISMRRAGAITEAAYAATLSHLRLGMTTLELISEVNHQLKKEGATTNSFVTSFYNMGPNHPFDFHNREQTLLLPLDAPVSVSFDFGAVYDGYCYDYGRSVYFGEPDREYHQAYDLVITSQAAGIRALAAGHTCEEADGAARSVITAGGYGYAFRHRLGHGIGMDVHEPPFLTVGDTTLLKPGMWFTVEPSIFIPHRLGARIEDVVMVGPEGGEALTSNYRALHVVH